MSPICPVHTQVLWEKPNWFYGRKVDPETMEDDSSVGIDRYHLISKKSVAWIQPMDEDRMYGGLIPVGPKIQMRLAE